MSQLKPKDIDKSLKPKGCSECENLVFTGLLSKPWVCLKTDSPPEPDKCELAKGKE